MTYKRHIPTVFVVAGIVFLLDAGTTILWQEPFSALYTQQQQSELQTQLNRKKRHYLPEPNQTQFTALKGVDKKLSRQEDLLTKSLKNGSPAGYLRIPKLNLKAVVLYGSNPGDLRKGPGFYEMLALPGSGKTVAIAGHRTTYLAPFRHLDQVKPEDKVSIEMPYGTFTYRVKEKEIIDPSDTAILRGRDYEWLVLTTCDPIFSAKHRLVIGARLVSIANVKFRSR